MQSEGWKGHYLIDVARDIQLVNVTLGQVNINESLHSFSFSFRSISKGFDFSLTFLYPFSIVRYILQEKIFCHFIPGNFLRVCAACHSMVTRVTVKGLALLDTHGS